MWSFTACTRPTLALAQLAAVPDKATARAGLHGPFSLAAQCGGRYLGIVTSEARLVIVILVEIVLHGLGIRIAFLLSLVGLVVHRV
jgi:hypothetical protein